MKRVTSTISAITLAAASVLAACPASAHAAWITVDKRGGRLIAELNYGDTDKRATPDRDRVVALDLVTAAQVVNLRKPLTPSLRYGKPVLDTKPFSASAGSLLSITYDNGFWVESPTDKSDINSTRALIPAATSEHWTVKYGKMLLGAGAFSRVLHSRLELIPLKDPFNLRPGQKLPVRLELGGKPMAGVKVAYGDGVTPLSDARTPFVTTDSGGIAEVPLARKGAYLLTADCEAPPLPSGLEQYDHLYVSLTFDTSRQAAPISRQ